MKLRKVLFLSLVSLVIAGALASSASAHLVTGYGSRPATSGTGCFDGMIELGEGPSGTIHLRSLWGSHTGSPCDGNTLSFSSGTGIGLMMLMKYTGSGPYAGGYSVCASWLINAYDSIGELSRHVDASASCGGGGYAAAICGGPSGYSSLYRGSTSSYLRNCDSGNWGNWVWTPDWHQF